MSPRMSRMSRPPRTRTLRRLALFSLLAACGSRTGLFIEDTPDLLPADAGFDARVGRDGGPLRDADDDEDFDAPPPLDARPLLDAANRTDCPDAAATLVYLISDDFALFSFDPSSNETKRIGTIACPAPAGITPFSMAVDRKGVAYIQFIDGRLYRVSTLTAACVDTPFQPNQQGFSQFGMGFATNDVGPTETLFVAGSAARGSGAEGLARIDLGTWRLTKVGDFQPVVINAELTGRGDGRLFGFYAKNTDGDPPSYIGEIDTATARVVGEKRLDGIGLKGAWAFAFWGGDFYAFTAPNGVSSVVTRWRPSNDTVTQVATLPARIVGAGVSTCAPQ